MKEVHGELCDRRQSPPEKEWQCQEPVSPGRSDGRPTQQRDPGQWPCFLPVTSSLVLTSVGLASFELAAKPCSLVPDQGEMGERSPITFSGQCLGVSGDRCSWSEEG